MIACSKLLSIMWSAELLLFTESAIKFYFIHFVLDFILNSFNQRLNIHIRLRLNEFFYIVILRAYGRRFVLVHSQIRKLRNGWKRVWIYVMGPVWVVFADIARSGLPKGLNAILGFLILTYARLPVDCFEGNGWWEIYRSYIHVNA